MKMNHLISMFIAGAACAHGLITAYYFINGQKEPEALQIAWRIAAVAGLYALGSFAICAAVTLLVRR
jgi:hypothetical protein